MNEAPVDRAALERSLAPFAEARGLPGEAYTSDGVFAWERRAFLEASWFCVGRAEDLSAAGAQAAVRVGGEGMLLVRGTDGALGAFANVCRHRGHELLEPGARREHGVITCPYHAWVYDLDGSLRGAPGFAPTPDERLAPVRVHEWRGFVFVDASGEAPSFDRFAAGLDALVAPYEPERLRVASRAEYDLAANWKLVHENYHECYHCSNIHPELCRVTPPESGSNLVPEGAWVGGTMELMAHAETMSLDGRSGGAPLPGLGDDECRRVVYVGLFPNLLLSLHPDYVLTHRLEPLAPDRTRVTCEWLFAPETLERPGFDPAYAVDFWDITNREDWRAVESLQRGVSSRAFAPGPFSTREDAVYQFVTLVARGYLEGRVTRPVVPRASAR